MTVSKRWMVWMSGLLLGIAAMCLPDPQWVVYAYPNTESVFLQENSQGWVLSGAPVTVRIDRGLESDTILAEYRGPDEVRRFSLTGRRLHYQSENWFSMNDGWFLRVGVQGFDLQRPVPRSEGQIRFNSTFQQDNLDLFVDRAGNLVGQDFQITRPVLITARREVQACSSWSLSGNRISFVCDDTHLGPADFPYLIDPSYYFQPENITISFRSMEWSSESSW